MNLHQLLSRWPQNRPGCLLRLESTSSTPSSKYLVCLFVLKTWIFFILFFFLFNDRHLYVKCVPCMTFKHQELQHGWFSSFIHFYCTLYTYDKDVVCKVLLSCSYCSCRCMVLHDISEEKLKWSFDENCLIFLCKTLGVCMCCLFQICLWRPSKIPSVMIAVWYQVSFIIAHSAVYL